MISLFQVTNFKEVLGVVVYKMGVEHIVLTIRGILCEGMWQFFHAVTVQACNTCREIQRGGSKCILSRD